MFNIPEGFVIIGLRQTGCSPSHVQACILDRNKHSKVNYSYFGKHVRRGTMVLHLKTGDYLLRFAERNNWATSLEIIAVP